MNSIRLVLPALAITANLPVVFGAPLVPLQTGAFGPQQVISTQANYPVSVYATDLDGDGDEDVLSASHNDNKIAWYENQGAGVFGAQQVISSQASGAWCVYATDLDGDGDADVLSASIDDDKIAWYENLGNGAFGSQQVITTQANAARSVYATDLDGDGDADVLSASADDDKIAWYENQGGGVFGSQQVISTQANSPVSVYATDLNGDGDADVLSASGSVSPFIQDVYKIAWCENLGGGAFGAQQVISTQANGACCVYATDLDGDGDTDVLSASIYDDKIAWYQNLGGGVFGSQQVISTQANVANSVYAVDLDGDGDADVLSASYLDDKIAWYENLGGGVFGSQQVISTQANSPASVYATDLDGDGDADVLSASGHPSAFVQDVDKIAWYENLTGPYDCNGNGILDDVEIAADPSLDCNGNGILDECDIASGSSLDQDGNGILDECLPPPLASNPVQISVASGGQHDLTLTAPQEYEGSLYFVLGSSSGTVPGWIVDGVHLPLQVSDPYFLYGVSSPNVSPFINTLGSLSATGTASAAIAVPSGLTDLAGVTIHHAYVLFGNSLEVVYASNAAPLELVP